MIRQCGLSVNSPVVSPYFITVTRIERNMAMSNPNQDRIEEAYERGVKTSADEGAFMHMEREIADIFVPDEWKSEEQQAFDAGYHDETTGQASWERDDDEN